MSDVLAPTGPAPVVTFGEAMLRLTPPDHRRLEQTGTLEVWPAGAELNVAVALARLGRPAAWASVLPDNPLGRLVAAQARAHGVDVGLVRWSPDGRLGLFFVEVGRRPRPSSTVYDRSASAFAELQPGDFDWPDVLTGACALHTSGITPALAPGCAAATAEALGAARRLGCPTSFDLNFRSLLTTPEAAAATVEELAGCIDTLIGSAGEIEAVFGLDGDPAEVAAELRARLGVPRVVVSSRVEVAADLQARRSACAEESTVFESESPAFSTVDPLGAGDAFSAGFLAGLLADGPRRGLELAGAAAALKQSIPGDLAVIDAGEAERLLRDGDRQRTRR